MLEIKPDGNSQIVGQLGKRCLGLTGALTAASLAEADAGAFPRLLGFDSAVPGWRNGMERIDEHAGSLRDLAHRLIEGSSISPRGFGEAADLAHELQCGGADLLVGGGRFKIEKRSNVTAHVGNTALPRACVKRRGCESTRGESPSEFPMVTSGPGIAPRPSQPMIVAAKWLRILEKWPSRKHHGVTSRSRQICRAMCATMDPGHDFRVWSVTFGKAFSKSFSEFGLLL
jgi:hypothetical protein